MKKIYFLLFSLLPLAGTFAQCVIDPSLLTGNNGSGVYPVAAHLPHIVKDSLYDQTVQGLIPDSLSIAGGFATITIDSVRLDSVNGLPAGINWIKNPYVLRGSSYGCVEFTGSTSAAAGTYPLAAVGMVWAHLTVSLLGINEDTSMYGSLDRMPPFNNYYVVVDSGPAPLSVVLNGTNLCYGDTGANATITANASGGLPTFPYTYLWSTGATTYTITGLYPGTYSVTVTSGSDTTSATSSISIQPTPLMLVTSTDSGSTGANGTATVTVSGGVGPYTYRWIPGFARTDSIDSLAAGTYRVTVTDSFGCRATDTAIVQNLCASLAVVTGDTGSTGSNGSAIVTASGGYPPYTYSWSNGATTSSITNLAPATYAVTVTDSQGCMVNANAIVANLTGISWTAENEPKISLFPNPANNSINLVIEAPHTISTLIEVIDMSGRIVFSAPVTISGLYNRVLNTAQFGAGIYTLQLSSGTQTVHQRFEVAH